MSEEYYCHKHSRAREIGESCPDCESETISSLRAEVDRLRAQLAEAQKVEKQEGMVSVEAVKRILHGIDETETDSFVGWWETSKGAEFGRSILKYIEAAAQGEG